MYLCTFISHGIKRNGNSRLIGILHKWGEFREGTALTHGTFDKKYSVLHLLGVPCLVCYAYSVVYMS